MARNEKIFEKGTIIRAKRKDIIKVVLGPLEELAERKGIIEHTDNGVILYTRESPNSGILYPANYICVLRIVGTDSLLKDDRYDLFALSPAQAEKKLFGVEVCVEPLLTLEQAREIFPVLSASKEAHGYQKFIKMRNVIIITPEMGITECYNDDDDTPIPINVGDAFIVLNKRLKTGYRIWKSEFEQTHTVFED